MHTVQTYIFHPAKDGTMAERVFAIENNQPVYYIHTYVGPRLTSPSYRQAGKTENREVYGDDPARKETARLAAQKLGQILAGQFAQEAGTGEQIKRDVVSYYVYPETGQVVSCRSQQHEWHGPSHSYFKSLSLRDRNNDGTIDWTMGLSSDNSQYFEIDNTPPSQSQEILRELEPLLAMTPQQSRYQQVGGDKTLIHLLIRPGERVYPNTPVLTFHRGEKKQTLYATAGGMAVSASKPTILLIDHSR